MDVQIKITRTEYEIKGSLPNVFPNLSFATLYNLGKPEKLEGMNLWVSTVYDLFKDRNKIEDYTHRLEMSSIYTLVSKHGRIQTYQLFREVIARQVEDFKKHFASLELIGYPLIIFPVPSLEEITPRLEEIFNPLFGSGVN